jgi:hypothetical protein
MSTGARHLSAVREGPTNEVHIRARSMGSRDPISSRPRPRCTETSPWSPISHETVRRSKRRWTSHCGGRWDRNTELVPGQAVRVALLVLSMACRFFKLLWARPIQSAFRAMRASSQTSVLHSDRHPAEVAKREPP